MARPVALTIAATSAPRLAFADVPLKSDLRGNRVCRFGTDEPLETSFVSISTPRATRRASTRRRSPSTRPRRPSTRSCRTTVCWLWRRSRASRRRRGCRAPRAGTVSARTTQRSRSSVRPLRASFTRALGISASSRRRRDPFREDREPFLSFIKGRRSSSTRSPRKPVRAFGRSMWQLQRRSRRRRSCHAAHSDSD